MIKIRQLKGFVMGLKDLISSLFTYKQPEKHSFVLLESNDEESNSNNNQNSENQDLGSYPDLHQ